MYNVKRRDPNASPFALTRWSKADLTYENTANQKANVDFRCFWSTDRRTARTDLEIEKKYVV